MGLINEIRKRRDSWMGRLEEHRQDEWEDEFNPIVISEKDEDEILQTRKMVGVFNKKEKTE
jgi:hypothetical protein